MPYLPADQKAIVNKALKKVPTLGSGQLNYAITQLCIDHLNYTTPNNYESYNAVLGALEAAKQEVYRRAVAPYEDQKIQENGDVYDALQ